MIKRIFDRLLSKYNRLDLSKVIANENYVKIIVIRVFQYAAKVCKIQFVTASRPHAVLDMRPSTTNNSTSNQDPKFTALTKSTLVSGPYLIPNSHHKIAHKPRPSVIQLWACCVIHIMTRSSCPSNRPTMT